LAFVIRIQA